jgi:LPS sulfotransferase NodH
MSAQGHEHARAAAPTLSYVICTAPRTGSTLLSAALRSTGIAGRPAEFFDIYPHHEDHWRKTLGITDESTYFDKVVAAGSSPNGVFGLKLHWHQIPALRPRLGLPPGTEDPHVADPLDGLLRQRLGPVRYLWLRRRDLVAQGISYCLAAMTSEWRRVRGQTGPAEPRDIAYSYRQVDRHVRLVEGYEAGWVDYFRRMRIPALVLVYEDFVTQYLETVHAVVRFLGLPTDGLKVGPPQLERQADARSREWAERYRRERAGATAPVATPVALPRPSPAPPAATPARRRRREAAWPDLPFLAYDVSGANPRRLVEAPPGRAWMDASPRRFAYRCLPMVIANQAGWLVLSPQRIAVTWDGRREAAGLVVDGADGTAEGLARSHFGSGILTFHMGYVFRTPPGWNLHVRGPANMPKDGIAPLEGIVETDWSESTFTMNWQVTRPGQTIVFEKDEPIAMVSPVRRGELERFRPEIRTLAEDAALQAGFRAWAQSREQHNTDLRVEGSAARREGWQRHYQQGRTVTRQDAPEHQTALSLAPFVDRRGSG